MQRRTVCIICSCFQAIPQFCASFPALADRALSAQFDLVEDPEAVVRIKAISALPDMCKDVCTPALPIPLPLPHSQYLSPSLSLFSSFSHRTFGHVHSHSLSVCLSLSLFILRKLGTCMFTFAHTWTVVWCDCVSVWCGCLSVCCACTYV